MSSHTSSVGFDERGFSDFVAVSLESGWVNGQSQSGFHGEGGDIRIRENVQDGLEI